MNVLKTALFGLLGLCGCMTAIGQTAAPMSAPNIVLLTTYVVSPARLAKLQAAALQAGVAMQTVSAEEDTPDALQKALRSASLLVVDTPHPSVAQPLLRALVRSSVKAAGRMWWWVSSVPWPKTSG